VIRRGRWKLIESFDPEARELYDLEADLGETTDVAAEYPDVVAELAADLTRWRDEVGAEPMRPNPDYDPAVMTAAENKAAVKAAKKKAPKPSAP